MKITIVLLLAIVLVACSPATPKTDVLPEPEEEVRDFTITAYQYGFEPSNIEVKKGERVRLTFSSKDVDHGVYIPDFSASVPRFVQGDRKSVEFVANKSGTFTYYCNIFCGQGHREMKGTITVIE